MVSYVVNMCEQTTNVFYSAFLESLFFFPKLANQRLAKILSTVFRAIGNGNVPSSISELLTVRISNYNLRGDSILKLPKVNSTKYGIKSWRYQAARLWNAIPNNLRNIDTYRSFKRGLKELGLVGL